MDNLIKKLKTVYENSSSVLLATALIYAFSFMWNMKISVLFIILTSVVTIRVIKLISNKKNSLFSVILPLMIIILGLLLFKFLKIDMLNNIKLMFDWAILFFGSNGELKKLYAYIFIGIIVILINIITYSIDKLFKVRLSMAILLFVGGITLSIFHIDMPKFSVCVGLFYILNILIEMVNLYLNKQINNKNSKISAVYLMPICMLVAIIATAFPSKPTPMEWNWIKNIASSISTKAEIIFAEISVMFENGGGDFSIGSIGYSEDDKKLGGKISDSDGNMLFATVNIRTKASLYLTGSVRNNYTGDAWKSTASLENYDADEYLLDFFELINAFQRAGIPSEELKTLISKKSIYIEYDDIKTKSLFYTLKSYDIEISNNKGINTTNENILFKRIKGEGTNYQLKFIDINYQSKIFRDIVNDLDEFNYSNDNYFGEDFRSYVKDYFGYNINASKLNDMNNDYKKRAENIKKYYLNVPNNLPTRVTELALDLTNAYDNNYDKLKALEAYLNTFTYTTSPSVTPKNKDFVDYFLFEQKEGYCTYFASAMAVMGRCIGIPTRYVEGAILDYSDLRQNSTYAVSNNKAHAWVEAYIEGIGWIPLEATAGNLSNRYSEWIVENKDSIYDDYEMYYRPPTPGQIPNQGNIDSIKKEKAVKRDYSKQISIGITVVTFIIVIIIAIFTSYFIAKIRYERRLKKLKTNDCMFEIFNEIMYYTKYFQYELKPQDTILTFAERIGTTLDFNEHSFFEVAEIFMKARYAEKAIQIDELNTVILFKESIENELLSRVGKTRMFIFKLAFYYK